MHWLLCNAGMEAAIATAACQRADFCQGNILTPYLETISNLALGISLIWETD